MESTLSLTWQGHSAWWLIELSNAHLSRPTHSPFSMVPPKLKVGLSGLGRMGKRHALHFLNCTPRAELVAISTPDDAEIEWVREHLGPFGVTLYKSYGDMLRHDGLQAVVIASITSVHAEQATTAINANKHVLCEKPLSTSVEVVGNRVLS